MELVVFFFCLYNVFPLQFILILLIYRVGLIFPNFPKKHEERTHKKQIDPAEFEQEAPDFELRGNNNLRNVARYSVRVLFLKSWSLTSVKKIRN